MKPIKTGTTSTILPPSTTWTTTLETKTSAAQMTRAITPTTQIYISTHTCRPMLTLTRNQAVKVKGPMAPRRRRRRRTTNAKATIQIKTSKATNRKSQTSQ